YVEANQFYQGLYAAVKLHPDAIRLLTNNLLTQPNKYVLTHVSARKVRKYAYAKLLQHHIGLGSFKMFFSYFLRYLHASGSFYSGIALLGRILKRRLLVRI